MASQLLKLYGGGFSPMQYAPALWLDGSDQSTLYQERTGASATTLVASDADPVGTWSDKSGNARHVTAPSDAARPTYKTAIQNGRSVVRFDGADDTLNGSAFALGPEYTIYTVTQCNYVSGTPIIVHFDTPPQRVFQFRYNSATSGILLAFNTSLSNFTAASPALTSANYNVISGRVDAGSAYAGTNGSWATPIAITGTPNSGSSAFAIGSRSSTLYLPGNIGEVLLFPTALSTSQRQQVERYLGSKWGITLS